MSRYSPGRRQDGTSRTSYHEQQTTATSTTRQNPLSSRSFGTADNSPGKTYKRNSPLTERGSPVSRASSFSAGRSTSSRKNDTAETSGESPAKSSRSSSIPQATSTNRDGTSSLHSRLSSRAHQDTASSRTDSSYSGEHKQIRSGSDSNLPSPRRKSPEDSATKRDSSHIGPRALGRGQSESPSRSSQESDGGSPSNIPLRTSYRRGVEEGRSKIGSGRGASSSESADPVKTLPTDAPSKDKTSTDGCMASSLNRTTIRNSERSKLMGNLKTGSKTDDASKALSPPRGSDATSPRQSFDRGDIKYSSCRSRIPTPNSPSGSRTESPVRQKLSSHSFSASKSGNANNDEAGSSKDNAESRADRIARYKEVRRRELASKIKTKLDPETSPEPEQSAASANRELAPKSKSKLDPETSPEPRQSAARAKSLSEERSYDFKPAEAAAESSTAAKTSANRSATTDSTKIICGMKVSKNIAERAKKRQERMLRNRQHLSAEVIGRNAKINAVCAAGDEADSSSLKVDGQNRDQLQLSPLQEMDFLSPSSLSLSDQSDSSDISPADKRLSMTDLESLPEFASDEEMPSREKRVSVTELILSSPAYKRDQDEGMASSEKRVSVTELILSSPAYTRDKDEGMASSEKRVSVTELILSQPEEVPTQYKRDKDEGMASSEKRVSVTELILSQPEEVSTRNTQVTNIKSPPVETVVKMPPKSLDFPKTVPQGSKRTLNEDRPSILSLDKDTQHKHAVTSARNLSASSLEKIIKKNKSPIGSGIHDPGISKVAPDRAKKDAEVGYSVAKTSVKISDAKDVASSYAPPSIAIGIHDPGISKVAPDRAKKEVEAGNYGSVAKTSVKISTAKDVPSSYTPPSTKSEFLGKPPNQKVPDVVPQAEEQGISKVVPDRVKKEADAVNYGSVAKTSVKISTAKDVPSSYTPPSTKSEFLGKPPNRKGSDVVPVAEEQGYVAADKNRPKPPPSTVLYHKKLLESGHVKKDRKKVDYDLQKELDWLEHRRYQFDDEEEEKKLSVLEMVRARENRKENDEEKPRKPLARTMSEARGTDAAQSRKEILANRISSLGRTRSFGVGPVMRPDISSVLDDDGNVLPLTKDIHLDELLLKNVAYLDDENLPTEQSVRSLHPGENLKLRKSLRKKRGAKLSSLSEKGTSEDDRLNENVIEESGTTKRAAEIPASRATLNLAPAAQAAQKTVATPKQLPVSQPVTEPVAQSVISSVTPKPLQVTQKPARPTLVQNRPADTAQKQPPVTNPISPTAALVQITDKKQKQAQSPVKKPVSPSVAQSQISGTSQKQLHVTQPPVKKAVSPTSAKKPVSPTVAQSSVTIITKELPASKEGVTPAAPAQADVTDSPRKRARARSSGRPLTENVAEPANVESVSKRRRDKSAPQKAPLDSSEENLDRKGRDPNQELSPQGPAATEKSTAVLSFANNDASPRTGPPTSGGTTPSRRSRQKVRPEDIPAPILDVIKASLDYEQPETQSKVVPCPTTPAKRTKPPTRPVSASTKTVLDAPQAPVQQPIPEAKSPQGPVVTSRLSDTNNEQPDLQSKVVPCPTTPAKRTKPPTRTVSAGTKTVLDAPQAPVQLIPEPISVQAFSPVVTRRLSDTNKSTISSHKVQEAPAPVQPIPEAKSVQEYGPVITRRLSDSNKSTISSNKVLDATPAPVPTIPEAKSAQEYGPVVTRRLSDTNKATVSSISQLKMNEDIGVSVAGPVPAQSLKSRSDSLESGANTRMTSIAENNNSSKVPFHAMDLNSGDKSSTIKEERQSAVSEKPSKSHPEDISKVSPEDFTDVELFIREDTDLEKKARDEAAKLSLSKKASEPVSSQMRKTISSTTGPEDAQPQKTILSSEVGKPGISSAQATSTVSQTPVATTAAKTVTTLPEARKPSVTPSAPVTAAGVTTTTPTTKTSVPQEVKKPSAQVTSPVTTASVAIPASKTVTSVSSKAPEVKPAAVAVTSAPRVTPVPQAAVTSIVSPQALTAEVKKPAVTPAVTPVKSVVSSAPVTTPARVTPAAATSPSTTSTTLTKAPSVTPSTRVTSTISSAPVTATAGVTSAAVTSAPTAVRDLPKTPQATPAIRVTSSTPVSGSPTVTTISTGLGTDQKKPVGVTSSVSVTKHEPVTSAIAGVAQPSPVTRVNSAMVPRAMSLSPTLTENYDLNRSMELTDKDIENGNLMTRSFSSRMSEGSLNIPRRGILKRSGSLRSNSVQSELIDPELAKVFQARRILEKSEDPNQELAEEDFVFDDQFQRQDSLLSEIINEEAEEEEGSEETKLSVSERISQMETKIISTSGYTTPKTPRSRLGSVPRTLPENGNKKFILPQEELFNKLTDLARSKEASQESQKRYKRSRDDWRTRTQPVTLKEVEQADSLASVSSFRALVMKRSSINIFETLTEQDKRRRSAGRKTEYPQPYMPDKRDRKNDPRYKTLPVTADELMAIPEGETISLELLKSKMQALKESKTDSGIVSSGSDIEKDSQGSDSLRSLTTVTDEDDDFSHMSVASRASLFQQMEEKFKKSASGAKRYIDRKKRERSRTVPITEEEVTKAAEIVEEEAASRKSSLTITHEEHQAMIEKHLNLNAIEERQGSPEEEKAAEPSAPITLERLISHDAREEEKDTTKHSDDLTRQTLADKVKLFSSEKEREDNEKALRALDAPVIRRRNRRTSTRFNTQPITSEEIESVFRISPLAISLVKPPDPDILKGLPLSAQRDIAAQYAESCLSQQGSRVGSTANSRPGSNAGSRRGSIEESEDSKAETKGILKMADLQKDLQQVKSILKTESGRESPEREIKSILKIEAERKDSSSEPPSRSILKQDSNEQVKIESETRSILKSSEPEPRRTSKASEPRSALKKDSSWDKNGSEPRGILKKESSFDCKKEQPERGVLKHGDSKESKEAANQRGILKKESSIENLNSSEDSDISDLAAQSEEPKAHVAPEMKRKEKRRGSDERYLTQPVTDVEKKSPESPRKLQRYGSRHHKTQPVTPEEKKEASMIIQPVVKMSGSLAERLQALQKSGEEDWKKRISRTGSSSPSPSPDREIRSYSPESTPTRPVTMSERMNLLKSSQSSWRNRVEESDAKAFTVEGKLSKSGQVTRETSVVTKMKQTVRSSTESDINSPTSPTSPTKDWKIPIPTEIIASETTVIEETVENISTIVKLPELTDDGLDLFFGSTTNLVEKTELLDISNDDFDEIFQRSQNTLIHSVKSRPKKKVQARSKNPLKSRSANLERQEYEEFKTNVAEMEMKRIKKEALSKEAGFAEAALAGLASKENFSKIELRKTDSLSPSPGGHRYVPYKPLMLLHVKGRRHVQTRLVEPCARNVNQGDCYILVTPDKVINWIGEYSNIIEKSKSADVAAHIQQKKDMGYKSQNGIITIDSRKTPGSLFWSLLEGHESECQECGGVDEDEIYENAIISTNMIYQIEKNMLVPWQEYWGGLPKHEMLKHNQVYVYDFGAEIYVWQGKKAAPQKRKLGLELAQQLWDKGYNYEMSSINPFCPLLAEEGMRGASGQRPPWALIAKVNENMETVVFREKFADWPDSARLIKVKTVDSNSNKTENGGDLIPYDAQKLIDKETPGALLMTLDGSQVGRGTVWSEDMGGFIQEYEITTLAVSMWHILEFDHYKLEDLSNGQFHEGDTYVVRWEFRIIATGAKAGARRSAVGRERCAYFFWQGQQSTITEKGASALMTVELDEERGPQVRVLQGKEPPCFLNLFQGQMVVHIGKREEEDTNTQGAWRFYSVRHEKGNESCLIEIDAHISSLRSRSSFILFNVETGKTFIWHGVKSPQYIRKLAIAAVNSIQDRHPLEMGLPENVNVNITEMNEGSEKPEFWMSLRSRDRSQYLSLLNDPRAYNFSLRLFHFTSVSGVIDVAELRNPTISSDITAPYPFLQSDLYKVSQPALFLLDYGYEVYLWQGWWPEGDEEIENVLTGSAQARLMVERRCAMQTAVDYCEAKNVSVPIKPYLVYAGLEPMKFVNIFPFWDVDDMVKELQIRDGKCDGDEVSVEDELSRLSLVRYTFKELCERPLPEDVDPLKLESYLSDEEFEDALQMTKPDYYSLPAWKQSKVKQDIGLF